MRLPQARLDQVLDRFHQVEARMGAASDGQEIVRLSKEHAEMKPIADARLFDLFQGTGVPQGQKSLAIEVTLQPVEKSFTEVSPDEFDMMVIPGGGAPENLRIVDEAVDFTRRFVESGKPVGAICHGPQLLISAKVLDGRTLTSVNKIRDDLTNAGANYVDEALVVDDNLITSRVPGDLPQFNEALAKAVGLAQPAGV